MIAVRTPEGNLTPPANLDAIPPDGHWLWKKELVEVIRYTGQTEEEIYDHLIGKHYHAIWRDLSTAQRRYYTALQHAIEARRAERAEKKKAAQRLQAEAQARRDAANAAKWATVPAPREFRK